MTKWSYVQAARYFKRVWTKPVPARYDQAYWDERQRCAERIADRLGLQTRELWFGMVLHGQYQRRATEAEHAINIASAKVNAEIEADLIASRAALDSGRMFSLRR